MPVTQKDIARLLNISDSLVGKVLGDKPNVWASPELRNRIHRTAREMGYRPNAAARALARGQTNLVAVWSTHLNLHVYANYVAHLQALAHADGFQVLVRQVEYAPVEWDWPADGVICIDAPTSIQQYRATAPVADMPIVSLGVLPGGGVDEVVTDLNSGALMAMQALAASGRSRIAYLIPQMAVGTASDGRWIAYHAMTTAHGMEPELIEAAEISSGAAYLAMSAHIAQRGAPGALLVFAGEMATGAMRALHDHGLRVPDDVAVVSSGDSPELEFMTPSMSTIHLPVVQAAEAAWRLLLERRANPAADLQSVILPTTLVRRESLPAPL